MSRTYKKSYRGSKLIDSSCRNHGGCPFCEENRQFKFNNKGNKETEIKLGILEYDPYFIMTSISSCYKY